ncbi:MAG: class II fructose-bisphosphate aldolase [Rhodobacteraceae bacterium]|nr:class II fructose-bisphosphate aldolase [Paracoccaceae bacterium]
MTRANLSEVLRPALANGYAVPGFVCLGWEDARAFVAAATAENAPVILQAGPGFRAHTPISVIGAMFRALADSVPVPVVLHLDHGRSGAEIVDAISEGFTSVMFDGSDLPLLENIRQTRQIARTAADSGVSIEGELGIVGYHGGIASGLTDPAEAAEFVRETGVDALAIACGNTHLQTGPKGLLNEANIAAIAKATGSAVPLVIHGGSGVPADQRTDLARQTPICKFNIGTELRQTFGKALRTYLATDPEVFDRIAILKATEPPIISRSREILRQLGASNRIPGN